MGTFGGHALPGSFFIIFAMWWTIRIFQRYYKARFKGGQAYISSVTFPCFCCCRQINGLEVEGFIKIIFTAIGFTLEIITGFAHGKFIWLGNGQHATMFAFFGMSGIIDIMVHHRVTLPKGIEYAMMILAFTAEGVLFRFHLFGRGALDTLVHTLLVYVVFASVLAMFLEACFRRQVLGALCRTYLVLLQGTWFWQLGFIMYNPLPGASKWEEDNHDHHLIATMMFAWHMGVDFLIMLGIGIGVGLYYRRHGSQDQQDYDSLTMNLMKRNRNGQNVVGLQDGSDSDVEFERPPELRR